MKLSNSQQCISAHSARQAMTFTNLCGDRCKGFELIDMISVIFSRIFVNRAVDRRRRSCERAKPFDDEIRAIGK
jgi:hypothetical protein